MEESKQITLLEAENSKLKEENEVLFKVVGRMRNSINCLIERYIVGNDNK
ncbi:MAG: hypothetical protein RR768_02080 [Clostridium sp.]